MTLYDAVLNAPDYQTRKDALDRYRIEVLAEGMERAAKVADELPNWPCNKIICGFTHGFIRKSIRQAAKDLEDV